MILQIIVCIQLFFICTVCGRYIHVDDGSIESFTEHKLSRQKRSFSHLFDDSVQYASFPDYDDYGVYYSTPLYEESVIVAPTKKRLFVPNFWG